jgi:hypothetical protein
VVLVVFVVEIYSNSQSGDTSDMRYVIRLHTQPSTISQSNFYAYYLAIISLLYPSTQLLFALIVALMPLL